nr:nitroreductase family protein [Synergistales bacterium]
ERPWHFIVIREKEIRDLIPDIHPHALMVREAPLVIAVCADLDLEIAQGYWVQDCAAASQNILLEAQSQGLGAVWLGVHPREDRVSGLGKLLRIPERVRVFSLISVGYPAEEKELHDRYDETRVHWEDRW